MAAKDRRGPRGTAEGCKVPQMVAKSHARDRKRSYRAANGQQRSRERAAKDRRGPRGTAKGRQVPH